MPNLITAKCLRIILFDYKISKGDTAFKSSYLYKKFSCINKNGHFVKETDTFDCIVV